VLDFFKVYREIECMRTVTVSFSEQEFQKFGIKKDAIDFKELFEKISIEIARQAAYRCHEIAKQAGFADVSMDEINSEIKMIRENAKNRS
jgi:hypothetical protein